MQLRRAELIPCAARARGIGFKDFFKTENIRVEMFRRRFGVARHGDVDMMQCNSIERHKFLLSIRCAVDQVYQAPQALLYRSQEKILPRLAPKVRNSIAQRNALGSQAKRLASPERA